MYTNLAATIELASELYGVDSQDLLDILTQSADASVVVNDWMSDLYTDVHAIDKGFNLELFDSVCLDSTHLSHWSVIPTGCGMESFNMLGGDSMH